MTLAVRNVTKSFGDRTAVDCVSFEIAAGETYGLLGPNGAGKTTAISVICGLLEADSGTVHIGGDPVTVRAVEVRRRIGYVPQSIAVYPDLTAEENLEFFGRLHGLRGKKLSGRIETVLGVLGLFDRRKDRAETFSGGMQRRLNIGLGLLHEPELLVLDEPTVGVDPQSRNAILDAVEELSVQGLAVLYTTHYMEEAQRLCDRVAIMDEGTFVAEGTRRELIKKIGDEDIVRLSFAELPDLEALTSIDGVGAVNVDGLSGDVQVDDAAHRLPALLAHIAEGGGLVRSVEVIEPDLESVFLHLTGKALRDQ